MGRRRRASRAWAIPPAALLVLVSACGRIPLTDRLADYREEVASLVVAEPDAVDAAPKAARLPSRRERRIEVEDHRTSGRNFLAMQGCRLGELVGQRNSALGRVMVPSRRLRYEAEVLEVAADCLTDLEEERAEALREIVTSKRGELSAHVWNAVWMGVEMEAYLGASANPFAVAARGDASAGLAAALEVLERPTRSAEDAAELERALELLSREAPAGPVIAGLDAAARELSLVSALLPAGEAGGCSVERRRLSRLFESRYLPLQAEVAQHDRWMAWRFERLDALFAASQRGLPAVPESMQAYRRGVLSPTEPDGVWRRYRRAILQHADAWRPTLVACGVLSEVEDA